MPSCQFPVKSISILVDTDRKWNVQDHIKSAIKTWKHNQSVTQTSWDGWEGSDLGNKIKLFYYDFKAPKSNKVSWSWSQSTSLWGVISAKEKALIENSFKG